MEKLNQAFSEPFLQASSNPQLVWVLCMAAFVIIVLVGASLIEKKGGKG